MQRPSERKPRRHFLQTALGTAAAFALASRCGAQSGSSAPREPVIERISMLTVPGHFHRAIAMNAYDSKPKGQKTRVRMCRIALSDGTEGIGVMGYVRPDEKAQRRLRSFLGADPQSLYRWEQDRITGVAEPLGTRLLRPEYAWLESAVLDALGKRRGRPVWQLFGPPVRDAIDCYDGSLYFADVRDDAGPERIGELAGQIREDGYLAIKMKVGRPGKWMPGAAGVERDIECFIAAREAVGSNFNLMVDANNAYRDLHEEALKFLKAVAPYDLYWIEEIFPEERERYGRLRRELFDAGATTRIAEGESAMFGPHYKTMSEFEPWLAEHLFDVIQPDMRTIGFTHALRAADLAERYGKMFVPHNWNSELGKLMSVHLGRLRASVRFVEDDRWSNDALNASGYRFENGQWFCGEEPGWGVELTDAYARAASDGQETVIQ